eukprot:255602_1
MLNNVNLIVATIGTLFTFSIIIGIIIDVINRKKYFVRSESNLSVHNHWEKALEILNNIAIVSLLIQAIGVTSVRYEIYPPHLCSYPTRICTLVYHICRVTLYAIFILRVHVSFLNSAYQYSNKLIISPLLCIILFYFAFAIYADTIHVTGTYNYKLNYCVAIHSEWGVMLSGFLDVSLSIITLILFIRPLIKLRKYKGSNYPSSNTISSHNTFELSNTNANSPTVKSKRQSRRENDKLAQLMTKYTILVVTSIVSTFIMHCIVFLWQWTSDLAPIDDAINFWCIILIKQINNKVYARCCCICDVIMDTFSTNNMESGTDNSTNAKSDIVNSIGSNNHLSQKAMKSLHITIVSATQMNDKIDNQQRDVTLLPSPATPIEDVNKNPEIPVPETDPYFMTTASTAL